MSSITIPGGFGSGAPSPGRVVRRVRRPPTWPSFLAALLMHAALVGWLWFAVQWHTSATAPAVAVLWDLSAPEEAPAPAPPPPEVKQPTPPPKEEPVAPPKPDIVVKAQKEPPPKRKEEKPKPTPQELRRQQQQAEQEHQQEMARLASQVGTPGRIPMAGATGRPSNEYEGRVRAAVLANVHFAPPEALDESVYAVFDVELIPVTGEQVGEPKLIHASGLPAWDDAVRRAILRTDPFPRRDDGTTPRTLRLVFRPTDTR